MKKTVRKHQRSASSKTRKPPTVGRSIPKKPKLDLLQVTRDRLSDYAQRAVFERLSERKLPKGTTEFQFGWMSHPNISLAVNPAKDLLSLPRVLPAISARSEMFAGLKKLFKDVQSPATPEYRRIDPKKVTLEYELKRGFLNVSLKVKKKEYDYAVKQIVDLTQQIVLHMQTTWAEYSFQHFDIPEE